MLGTGDWGAARPDEFEWTPIGNGAREGLALAMGMESFPLPSEVAQIHVFVDW